MTNETRNNSEHGRCDPSDTGSASASRRQNASDGEKTRDLEDYENTKAQGGAPEASRAA